MPKSTCINVSLCGNDRVKEHYGEKLMALMEQPLLWFVTGFYPKLKYFGPCSHMNCCQHLTLHVTHQSTYFIYSFHQVESKFERTTRIQQLLHKLSRKTRL